MQKNIVIVLSSNKSFTHHNDDCNHDYNYFINVIKYDYDYLASLTNVIVTLKKVGDYT